MLKFAPEENARSFRLGDILSKNATWFSTKEYFNKQKKFPYCNRSISEILILISF